MLDKEWAVRPLLLLKGGFMAGVVENACQTLTPKIQEMGYEVVEIEYAKKVDGMNLTFVIDCDKHKITIDDCEKVHKFLDEELDILNPTNDSPYILNVESVGLDRPIKNERDFARNKNKEVEVKLYAPFNKKKIYQGNLFDFDDEKVVIESEGQKITFDRNAVSLITPIIKF